MGRQASRRVYEYAINQFITWYCSEPRLAFNRIVVLRYRMHLESRGLAANTINQQLAAVRRIAHEAADSGLLSPELAAGISRVKGVKQLGFRAGNWLSADESSTVLKRAYGSSLRAKRDYAMLAILFGCGLRRSELVGLKFDDIQVRQGHWAIVDLVGKGAHVDVKQLRFRKLQGRNDNVLTCVFALFNNNGRFVEGLQKTVTMDLKDETLEHKLASGITLKTSFDVKPGSYMVRLVVRDAEAKLMSAENKALEIR